MAYKEGCPFCRGETSAKFDGDNKMGLSIEFTEKKTYIVAFGYNASGQHKEVKIPIEYCPKCARELRIVSPSDTCEFAEPKEKGR